MKVERKYLGTFPERMVIPFLNGEKDNYEMLQVVLQAAGIISEIRKDFKDLEIHEQTSPGLYNLYAIYELEPTIKRTVIGYTVDVESAKLIVENFDVHDTKYIELEWLADVSTFGNFVIYGLEHTYPQKAKEEPIYHEQFNILIAPGGDSIRVVRPLTGKAHSVVASFKGEDARKLYDHIRGFKQ